MCCENRKVMCHHYEKYFYAKIKGTLGFIAFPQDFNE